MNQNNENKLIEQSLKRIESKLGRIMLLLTIIIAFLLIGFYRLEEFIQPIVAVIVVILIFAAAINLLAFLIDLKVRFAKEDDEEFIKQLEDEQNPDSP